MASSCKGSASNEFWAFQLSELLYEFSKSPSNPSFSGVGYGLILYFDRFLLYKYYGFVAPYLYFLNQNYFVVA
jgi:hypothetical protein